VSEPQRSLWKRPVVRFLIGLFCFFIAGKYFYVDRDVTFGFLHIGTGLIFVAAAVHGVLKKPKE